MGHAHHLRHPARIAIVLASVALLPLLIAACGEAGGQPQGQHAASTPPATSPVAPRTDASSPATAPATEAPRALPFGATTGRPVVYWISTDWCRTCEGIRAEWPAITADYGDSVQLITVDRDTPEGRAFAREHRIAYQPAFVVLDAAGQVTYAGLGPFRADEVRSLIARAAGE
jgi:hypothetical protein